MQMKFAMGCVAVWLVACMAMYADDPPPEKGPSYWMKQKLKYSQQILNGLAQEDFEKISKYAGAMKGLNKLEFFVRQKPAGYRNQLKKFQLSVNELAEQAEKENVDGATIAYAQLTFSCVRCHQELRAE